MSISDFCLKNDGNKEWLDEIILIFRTEYFKLNQEEINVIWVCMDIMLECVIQYKLINEDHI